MGIQDMLNDPNNKDPAQEEGYNVFRKNKTEYVRCVLCNSMRCIMLHLNSRSICVLSICAMKVVTYQKEACFADESVLKLPSTQAPKADFQKKT